MLSDTYTVCCDCKQYVKNKETGEWIEMPEIVERMESECEPVSHGYCPFCLAKVNSAMDEFFEDEEVGV